MPCRMGTHKVVEPIAHAIEIKPKSLQMSQMTNKACTHFVNTSFEYEKEHRHCALFLHICYFLHILFENENSIKYTSSYVSPVNTCMTI